MKKFSIWPAIAAIAFLASSCGGGGGEKEKPLDPEPVTPVAEEIDPPIYEPIAAVNPRIDDGRHATAYVTYYGSLIPDGKVITHIN